MSIFYLLTFIIISIIFLSTQCYNILENFTEKKNLKTCFAEVMTPEEDKILEELINVWNIVSNKLDIKWSICGGTYIGSVRNAGRIPWDDDFDITIMKEDIPKFKNIDKLLKPYNVSLVKFWGGYKIFFNDERAIKKFSKYKWNWPFIDIFAYENGADCSFLKKEELPLIKTKFDNTSVFIPKNISKSRNIIKNQEWKNEIFDNGYRHQLESYVVSDCPKNKIN
jgi:phosphorylcholine metabolism protein LicD